MLNYSFLLGGNKNSDWILSDKDEGVSKITVNGLFSIVLGVSNIVL